MTPYIIVFLPGNGSSSLGAPLSWWELQQILSNYHTCWYNLGLGVVVGSLTAPLIWHFYTLALLEGIPASCFSGGSITALKVVLIR